MKIAFWKMQATGNDYVYIDRKESAKIRDRADWIKRACDRHFGIGGDGVVVVDLEQPSMEMFNSDGSRGAICGNALRSVAHLMYLEKGLDKVSVSTDCGVKTVTRVGMGYRACLGVSKVIEKLSVDGKDVYIVDVGNRHAVCFGQTNAERLAVKISAKNPALAAIGFNTEVVSIGRETRVEVFERGTGYTLACGSGACAAAQTMWTLGICPQDRSIDVWMDGGKLIVEQEEGLTYLTGDAHLVAKGEYYD